MNQTLKSLKEQKLIRKDNQIAQRARDLVEQKSPCRAVNLVAGTGMRMVPIIEISKGLLEIKDEALIERTIRQLQERSITDITIVVGFMKGQYEYLMD